MGSPRDSRQALQAIHAGAHEYLGRGHDGDTLAESVVLALRGGAPLAPPGARAVLQRVRAPSQRTLLPDAARAPLTPRESEGLQWLALGHRDKEIATRLSVSSHTISSHVKRLYPKLGVHAWSPLRRLMV